MTRQTTTTTNYTLAHHPNTVVLRDDGVKSNCGACGPIAYRDGVAWSVNVINGVVCDWRYELTWSRNCTECVRHVERAKNDGKPLKLGTTNRNNRKG